MITGLIIAARYNFSGLPGKVLLPIAARPLLGHEAPSHVRRGYDEHGAGYGVSARVAA